MGRKAGSCCDTFSPAPEVLTGLHWGVSEGEEVCKRQEKKKSGLLKEIVCS